MTSETRLRFVWVELVLAALAGCSATGQSLSPEVPLSAPGTSSVPLEQNHVMAPPASARALLSQSPGALYTWGDNDAGQLGVGTISDSANHFDQDAATPEPAHLPSGTQVVSMAGGLSDTAAVTTTGAVYVTGYNGYGQLGNGTSGKTTDVTTPVLASVPNGVRVEAISMGHDQVLALTTSGLAYTWGENLQGEAGTGSTKHAVDVPSLVTVPAGASVAAIGTGGYHDLVVTSAGSVYTWGLNANGQLGNDTTINSAVPVAVSMPSGVHAVAVAGGDGHSLMLSSSGAVYAWGLNDHGQLGNGTTTQSDAPVKVLLPSGTVVKEIAAGENYSLALDADGTIYAWGDNASANLGNGTRTDSDLPVVVQVPGGVIPVQIAAGGNRCHLLSSSNQMYDWGSNENGKHTDLTPTLDAAPPGETPVAIADGVEAEQYLVLMSSSTSAIVPRL